jgi:hypothetical protein
MVVSQDVYEAFSSAQKALRATGIGPIATAPLDGTIVKVLDSAYWWIKARYVDGKWLSVDPLTYNLRTGKQLVVNPEWWRWSDG